ncbi:MAG: hypothetical protein K2Q06_14405 [Parvularculaceae bacterium]|nr:hypothetical protein [Parvularculaceae bacterium]
MRFVLIAIAAAAASACADAGVPAANAGGAAEAIAEVTPTVTRIVREFADDPNAKVKIEKIRDIMVCGTVATNGVAKRFSVDLVDEEAFFAEDSSQTDALVSMAC